MGIKLLNDLCEKEKIGGTLKNGGFEKIFDPNTVVDSTYYWDDGAIREEGIITTFPEAVTIVRIELYSTDRYPLGDVKFILDDNVIHTQSSVSGSNPMIFEGKVRGKKLCFFRYLVRDSVISKILIYGKEEFYCMNKDGEDFVYEDTIKLTLTEHSDLIDKSVSLEEISKQYIEKEKDNNIRIKKIEI